VILFKISAWDTNCPQHIPQKFDAADVAAALASRDARIAELEAETGKIKNCGIGSARIALKPPQWKTIGAVSGETSPCPGLRRLLLVFKQLAALYDRRRRRARPHSAKIRQRQIVGDALRG